MIQLRLSTPDSRQNLTIDENKTPKDIITENQIITDGADISIDGVPINVRDMNTSFKDLGCVDSVVLSVVVKSGNA